jgi:HK97 family phage portal protein
MQMIETRKMQGSEIARFFGVPEVLIGAGSNTSSAWPASYEAQQLHFLQHTIQPYLDEWEAGISESLISQRSIFADHDPAGFIKMDSTAKAGFLATLSQNGLMSRNEARRVLNLPEVAGGDDLTVQTNLSPIGLLGENNADQTRQSDSSVQPQIRQ